MDLAQEVEVLIQTLASLPIGAMATDCDGVIRWANAALSALTGYGVDEVAGRSAEMLEPEKAAHPAREILQHVVTSGEPWKGRSVGRRRSGELYDAEQTVTPIRDAAGKTTHLLWTKQDIFNDSSPIPYHSLNADGCIIAVNEAWLRGLGYTREEVIGHSFGEFLAPDQVDFFRERFPGFKERGRARDIELRMVRKDGTLIHASLDGDVSRDSSGQFRQSHTVWRDITARKLVTEQLEELQKVVGAAQRAAHFGVFKWNVKTGQNQWSPETFHLYGLDPATTNPSYDVWLQTIHPDDRDRILNELRQTLASREGRLNIEYRSADGRRWIASTGQLYRDSEDQPDHIVGINIDVTERKRTEDAVQRANESVAKAERHYRQMFNSVSDGVLVYQVGEDGSPGQFVEANDVVCRHLGYTREELLRLRVFDITPADKHPGIVAALRTLLTERQLVWEGVSMAKGGRETPIEANVRVFDLDGSPMAIACVRDITERKQMVEALRKSEERFAKTFLSSPAVTCLTDLDDGDRFLDVNEAFEKVSGYGRDEAIGRTTGELALWADPREYEEATVQFRAAGGLRNFEYHFRRKSGDIGTGLISAELIELDGRRCALAATIDITDRKLAEEEVRLKEKERNALEDQLRQAQKLESVGRLAGGVAHDFNNLLTVINGYSELLIGEAETSGLLRSYAKEIRNAGERAASLTRQLLAFSRKQMIRPRAIDLNTAIRESLPMLQRLIGEDIALETHLDNAVGQVMADPDQINQVIMNLAANARDAMPDGGKLNIETANIDLGEDSRVAVPGRIPGPYILTTVTDTGHGMDEVTRENIFEPFFTTKGTGKGTGLGLSTVYGIIRQSGGWIDVWSEPGVGTSLKVYLPRVIQEPVAETEAVNIPAAGGSETILVVEDQAAVRSFTIMVLKQYGYCVIEASDGDEAISLAARYPGDIHLLLTDVVLPGMNGKELSGRLKEVLPNLKVLFTSGYTANVIAHRGVLEPGVAFLHKPFSPDELAAKVREALTGPSEPAGPVTDASETTPPRSARIPRGARRSRKRGPHPEPAKGESPED